MITTTRGRIDALIAKARVQQSEGTPTQSRYWTGYIGALNELKLTVKPSERSIDNVAV